MKRELTLEEREMWIRHGELLKKSWERLRTATWARVAPALERIRKAHGELLDARMECGFYEEDLAESHGGAEDVFV